MRPPFAYVFERFPSFTQTFCAREVLELHRQGVRPLIFSIHDTREEAIRHFPRELTDEVATLPQGEALVQEVKALRSAGKLPSEAVLTLRHWKGKPDKRRVHEACWIGARLEEAGVRHVHAHFAGLAARTCWWLRQFFDVTFSFTGHANDILCPEQFEVSRDRLMEDATRVVTVSDFTARRLQLDFALPSGRVRRVYNGLDLAPILALGDPEPEEPPLIVSVGRLIEKKGFEVLVEACARLRDRGQKFRCEIIGEGERRASVEAGVADHGLEEIVVLRGAQAMEVILSRLHRARLFVLASVTEVGGGMDNLPTVIMEAMAAALPVVSTRLAGIPEMVEEGVTGFLVPEQDPAALADAMAKLLADRLLADAFGTAGRSRARDLFAKEVTARQFRRALVGGGLTGWSAPWLADDPALVWAVARQGWLRAQRLAGLKRRRKQRFPEEEARRKGGTPS